MPGDRNTVAEEQDPKNFFVEAKKLRISFESAKKLLNSLENTDYDYSEYYYELNHNLN